MAVSIIGEAAVRLRPNAEGFQTEAEVGILGPLRDVAGKAAGFFAAAFAAQKVGEFIKDSITQASDLNESASKVGVVFGDSAKSVEDFAHTAAASLGQSEQQALEATGTFGNLFRSLGLGQQQSAGMSTSLVQLAGDLASFNNVDPAQALDALRSGLVGETEPLRQFGVNLNQASIKQQALKMGLDASGPTLSANVQAQAAYALILQQTSLAQGDFARTSAGLANQTRIMSAQWTDLKGNVGSAFLPFVNLGARAITGVLMPALLTSTSYMKDFGERAGTGLAAMEAASRSAYGGAAVAATDWQSRVGAAFGSAANTSQAYLHTFAEGIKGTSDAALLAEPTLTGFLARFGSELHGLSISAGASWQEVRTSALTAVKPLEGELGATWKTISFGFASAFGGTGLTASGTGFVKIINDILGKAAPLISGWISGLAPMLASIFPAIRDTIGAIIPVVATVFKEIGPLIGQVLPVFEQVSGIVRTLFLTALQALLPVLPPIVTAVGQVVTVLASGLAPVISTLAPLLSTLVNVFVGEFKAVLQSLVPIIPPLVNALSSIAQVIVGALLTVLQALLPVLPVLAQAFGQIATAVGGALIQAVNALAPVLPTLLNAFVMLIQAALMPLLPLLPVIASLIPPLVGVIVALVNAIAPFLPLIVQVVATLIQLAVAALVPLMPVIQVVANLLVILVAALMPLIVLGVQLLGVFLNLGAGMIGAVVGAVSSVIGWFQKLLSGIAGVGATISRVVGGFFDGLADGARSAFDGVIGVIKWFINAYIGIVNSAIGFVNRDLIANLNKIPGVSIPSIPTIPKLHSGGVFDSGQGEGLALLRDQELVVTPEQRVVADNLLRDLLAGQVPAAAAAPAAAPQPPVQVTIPVTQLPGESGVALAARVSDRVVFNLNNGVTTTVGAGGIP